jgi:hypothetical protein
MKSPRRALLAALPGLLAAPALLAQPAGPPHAWVLGSWTGGLFPPVDTEGAACFAQPSVIFLRDSVMRVASLDFAYRQRLMETVAATADGALEFRFVPVPQARGIPEIGFGCGADPDRLLVRRIGPDEIAFPGCVEFPATLRRCRTPAG